VERWEVDGASMLIKRDDLSSVLLGGNKVRALELLLAGVGPDHTLLTVGPTGSTHALAVAQYGSRLGAAVQVITWPQQGHAVALATAARLERLARVTAVRSPGEAYVRAAIRRLRGRVTWIPAGGSAPLGVLGHASAALELVEQLTRETRPTPDTIVVPLGSGGTAAGLLVGLALAGSSTRLLAVRVAPRVIANRSHVLRLARRGHALLEQRVGGRLPPIDASRLELVHDAYGGGYAHETDAGRDAEALLHGCGGPRLDGTYSAKAFGHALALARSAPRDSVLFWLTFDGRWLDGGNIAPRVLHPPR